MPPCLMHQMEQAAVLENPVDIVAHAAVKMVPVRVRVMVRVRVRVMVMIMVRVIVMVRVRLRTLEGGVQPHAVGIGSYPVPGAGAQPRGETAGSAQAVELKPLLPFGVLLY